ncbi:MAG: hypothetical protein C0606_14195 [Hyphomicrobiales bacterium]|nr:MAG: hypothetical protein C0606_14195 [Hyphomicrobiales bacterium]
MATADKGRGRRTRGVAGFGGGVVVACLLSLAGCANQPGPTNECLAAPSLGACTSAPSVAGDAPPPSAATSAAQDAYERQLLLDMARLGKDHLNRTRGPADPGRPLGPYAIAHLKQGGLVRQLERNVAADAFSPSDSGGLGFVAKTGDLETPWRHAVRAVGLDHPDNVDATAILTIADTDATALDLRLRPTRRLVVSARIKPGAPAAIVKGRCDGPSELHEGSARAIKAPGERFVVTVHATSRSTLAPYLRLGPSVTSCELAWHLPGGQTEANLRIVRNNRFTDAFSALDRRIDTCVIPHGDRLSGPARIFFEANEPAASCILPATGIDLYPQAVQGFAAKSEALLGHPLSRAFIEAQDPFAPLSFANAPRLEAIFISSLAVKSDFSGQVIGRLLAHHADRGTPVRILVAAAQTYDKDRAFLDSLARDHPNIHIDIHRWKAPPGAGVAERLAQLHRVQHIKTLVTLSRRDRDNVVILGGRNIQDSYLFRDPADLSRWGDLNQYTKGYRSLNPFVYYRDFDIRLRGRFHAERIAAQILSVWNRDATTFLSRRPAHIVRSNRQIAPAEIAGRTLMRQVVSVPYADGHALARLYVRLIDSAEHSIDIVNPYLNPPPAIEAAIDRALDRGVRMRILTRIDLEGDIAGKILSQVNKRFINRHYERIAIHENTQPDTILHAKLLLIDGELSVVGSVNFNKRSFIHDTENAFLILSKRQNARLMGVIDQMDRTTRPVTHHLPVPGLWKALLAVPIVDKIF